MAAVLLLTLCIAQAGVHADAQVAPGQAPQLQQHPLLGQDDDTSIDGQFASTQEERMLSALNAQRQRAVVNDTNKLLRLINEFNTEIARTSPAALTSDQVHKLAEIEKLARSVREKMAQSVRGTPAFLPGVQLTH